MAAVLGSSTQFGFHTGVINNPKDVSGGRGEGRTSVIPDPDVPYTPLPHPQYLSISRKGMLLTHPLPHPQAIRNSFTTHHFSEKEMTIAVSIFAIGGMVGALPTGIIADIVGRLATPTSHTHRR